jgi:aspartyl-tRNA(Asn)/glutamyl-tRNA(Gln) amidotransferase subunit B
LQKNSKNQDNSGKSPICAIKINYNLIPSFRLNKMSVYETYEPVIGLEVHAQLHTNSKAYCSDATEYGAMPNTQISPVSLGHPGTLPFFNEKVLESAIKLGLACQSQIREENQFARKNYFYADLPKGYQITQDKTPICNGGFVLINDKTGKEKKIGITRIHMEEDAGKSIHDVDPFHTLVDINRAGVALVEIVSDPDLRSPEEAYSYLTEIRKLVRYLDICDGNMEEGSLRCDANVSVRKVGSTTLGNRVEIKNMNSIRNVQRAIEGEIIRQIDLIESGNSIAQETHSFDASTGKTFVLRSKEMANDYRYFPEPDLLPVFVSTSYIDEIKSEMPPLPRELFIKYTKELGLSDYDAGVLTDSREFAMYFEKIIQNDINAKSATNFMMGSIKSFLNERALDIMEFPLSPNSIAELIRLVDDGTITNNIAGQKIFPAMLENPNQSPSEIAQQNNWLTSKNDDELIEFIEMTLKKYPEKVEEYRNGKKGLTGLFMGEVMKLSKGKADPKKANELLLKKLEQH